MSAGSYDLYIEQGATFSTTLALTNADGTDKNLTGYTFLAQIRTLPSSSTIIETITTALGSETNQIDLSLTNVETSAIPVDASTTDDPRPLKRYYWDIEMTSPGGVVTRLLEGAVDVSPEVSRV